MSFQNIGHRLRGKISDQSIAEMVSTALRREHQDDTSAIKNICANTGVNLHTIPKWYQFKNAPKGSHLLMLATVYPQILKGLLELIGRPELWQYCQRMNVPRRMYSKTNLHSCKIDICGDNFVHLNISIATNIAVQLNIRQLWFLGELQNGEKCGPCDITKIWQKSKRTAKRDIRELIRLGMIEFIGANKTGYYNLV